MGETPAGFQVTATTRGVLPGDWVYSNQIVDKAGHAPTTAFLDRACPLGHASAQVNAQTGLWRELTPAETSQVPDLRR
jgi:hypothetical protein